MSRYIPLPCADHKRTVSLQSLDNAPTQIQCCQVLNKYTHKPRNDTDIAKLGGSTAVRSKHDEWTHYDETRRNKKKVTTPSRCLLLWWDHMSAGRELCYSSRNYCMILRADWMLTETVGMSCALDWILAFVTKTKVNHLNQNFSTIHRYLNITALNDNGTV
jgi:hypothetical protein